MKNGEVLEAPQPVPVVVKEPEVRIVEVSKSLMFKLHVFMLFTVIIVYLCLAIKLSCRLRHESMCD